MDSTLNMTPGLTVGDKLLSFEVKEQLASGGQGIVWKAYDALLDRHVAIKQIAEADVVDEAMRQKFRSEADLQKKVSTSSSHVVDVIDLVDDHRGLFIVMEFVEGQSLDRLLSATTGPLEPIVALKVVRDVALGLAAIHKAGIVHRDLKPGNILLPADGSPAKICDFGLARLMEDQDTMSTGTVAYMAPELFGGDGADGRADIYALGMVSYEMVAGRPAFEQAFKAVLRDQRNQAMRWMKWHTNVRVTAPPLTELNEKAPSRLTELIERMMAKDPGQRIASAAQLVEAIARHFGKGAKQERAAAAAAAGGDAAGATAAPAPSPMAAMPTAALGKKRKWPVIVAGLVVFWTVVLGGVMFYQDYQKQSALDEQLQEGQSDFNAARDAFKDEQWADAETQFAALAKRFPDHPLLGAEAEVGSKLAASHLAAAKAKALMSDGDFDGSVQKYTQTIEVLETLDTRIDQAQADHQADLRRLADTLGKQLGLRKAFVSQIANIDGLLKGGKTQDAAIAYEMLKKSAPVMIPAEQAKMADVFGMLQGIRQQEAIRAAKEEAEVEFAGGNMIAGRRILEEAIDRYGNHPMLVDTLALHNKEANYNQAIQAGDSAFNNGELGDAITHYQRADQIKPSADLKQKIFSLQMTKGLADARREIEGDNIKGAEAILNRLKGLDPKNQEVTTLLASIAAGKNFAEYVNDGNSHLAAKRFQDAIGSYTQALELKADPDVERSLTEARIGLFEEQMLAAAKSRNLNDAGQIADKILALDANHARAARMKQQIQVQRELEQKMADGASARAKGDYVKSKKIYRELRDYAKSLGLPDTFIDKVNVQLNAVELDHLVQQIEGAMETKNLTLAEATLDTAFAFAKRQNVKDERLVKLLERLDELKKKFG